MSQSAGPSCSVWPWQAAGAWCGRGLHLLTTMSVLRQSPPSTGTTRSSTIDRPSSAALASPSGLADRSSSPLVGEAELGSLRGSLSPESPLPHHDRPRPSLESLLSGSHQPLTAHLGSRGLSSRASSGEAASGDDASRASASTEDGGARAALGDLLLMAANQPNRAPWVIRTVT